MGLLLGHPIDFGHTSSSVPPLTIELATLDAQHLLQTKLPGMPICAWVDLFTAASSVRLSQVARDYTREIGRATFGRRAELAV